MDLGKHIGSLLYDHDCVIIPEFGGFVANYKSARIHEKLQIIVPPSKQVNFNGGLKNNDGLLANRLAHTEALTYDQALQKLRELVADYEQQLLSGQRVELNKIGVLYRNKEGGLQFIADENQNFLKSAFAHSQLFVAPVVAAMVEQPHKTVVEVKQTPVVAITRSKGGRRGWVAAAIMIPVIAVSGWLLKDQFSTGHINVASLNPFGSRTIEAEFTPRFEEENIVFDYAETTSTIEHIKQNSPELTDVYFSFPEDQITPDGIHVILDEIAEESAINEKARPLQMWFIVGGAFGEKSNADRMADKLKDKGYDAYVFDKSKGLHMVCYASFTNRAAALKALKTIKAEDNSNAWLKKQ
jgi:nucleoid DNA-binding protein